MQMQQSLALGVLAFQLFKEQESLRQKKIIALDINNSKKEMAIDFGTTDFLNPKEIEGTVVNKIIKMTDGGVDYTFESVGNVNT